MRKSFSPYEHPNRLQDVIAAVTVLASARSSELEINVWVGVLSKPDRTNQESERRRWKAVFEQHPEFFIVYNLDDKRKAALRLRYSNRTIDRSTGREHERLQELTAQERFGLTSLPLNETITNGLITTAINLHTAVLARKADRRVWVQLVAPALGLIGVIAGALLSRFLSYSPA
jgi:hypothetical protein